jgi:hypothetical protein
MNELGPKAMVFITNSCTFYPNHLRNRQVDCAVDYTYSECAAVQAVAGFIWAAITAPVRRNSS